MKTISSGLQADIAAGTIARILKITCKNGSVIAVSDTDLPITVEGVTYQPSAGFQSLKVNVTADAQVSNQSLGSALVSVPEADILGGVYDGAVVEAAWASWQNPSYGKLVFFQGTIGDITWTEAGFLADIVSYMRAMELNMGHVVSATCRHQLFSTVSAGKIGACTLSATSYTFTGSVNVISIPKWKFTVTGLSQADGYFDNGTITFTSGNNAGLSAVVKEHTAASGFKLFLPTAFTFASGDTFSVQAGCDKTLATCRDKFNNVVNFGGFPHINTDVNLR
jgi:uncharacterized phage protein (TIGR02218 family)